MILRFIVNSPDSSNFRMLLYEWVAEYLSHEFLALDNEEEAREMFRNNFNSIELYPSLASYIPTSMYW